jgi:hypothetical protein
MTNISNIMNNISVYINNEFAGQGLYMDWLFDQMKNFEDILCPYSYLDVYDNEDGSITFRFRADDCVQAEFKWKNEKLWLISPFLDDDEVGDITADEFDKRLREFAVHHGLRHVITSDIANKEMYPWIFML